MKRIIFIFFLCLITANTLPAQDRISRQAYIDQWSLVAMAEMERTGIPASIKLAQACLESDNGNSRLAREGKNHFGIKCHDWTGQEIRHDDDEKNECFRKYRSAEQSFMDHSDFLTTKSRYADLFELKPDDYKGWARGLKKAGYATAPKYADLLITIIEENELNAYDKEVLSGNFKPGKLPGGLGLHRPVMLNNNVEYIISRKGDTPKSLREEFDLYPREIQRYNDVRGDVVLDSGIMIYLQPKRFRAEKGMDLHTVAEGETLMDISREYGIKPGSLRRKNNLDREEEVTEGMILWLRKRRPAGS